MGIKARVALAVAAIMLLGAGSAHAAPRVDPAALDLGTANFGEPSAAQTITLTVDPGEEFRRVAFTILNGEPFEMTSDSCTDVTLPETGGSCQFAIRIRPGLKSGSYQGDFTINMRPADGDSEFDLTVPLTGAVGPAGPTGGGGGEDSAACITAKEKLKKAKAKVKKAEGKEARSRAKAKVKKAKAKVKKKCG